MRDDGIGDLPDGVRQLRCDRPGALGGRLGVEHAPVRLFLGERLLEFAGRGSGEHRLLGFR